MAQVSLKNVSKIFSGNIKAVSDVSLAVENKEFMVLVGISFVLAVVPAWYFMGQWLAGFAYRIDLNVVVFASAGLIAFLVASVTIGFQALKAARTNPVNSLRYE